MMEGQVKIHLGHQEDAQFIALLGRITFTETFGHLFRDKQDLLDYCEKTFSVAKLEKSLAKPENIFWIAYADRLPIGYAKLKLNSTSEFLSLQKVCQLQKIYVLKDFLSMKVGSKLQQVLLNKAKELGYEHVWLSVLNENVRAISFYEKNAFKIIGKHDFSIGKEDFGFMVMTKKLQDFG